MKKVALFLISMLVMSGLAFAQGESKTPGIYYGDQKLGTSRITGQKLGNLVGAYLSMGLSGAKRDLTIEGKTAMTHLKDIRPEFTVVFSSDSTAFQEVFNDISNLDNLVLV